MPPAPAAPPLIVLSGPTAAGKTALSLQLALDLDAEIISADSRQVYRGLDIGTAKASASERARIPHHLLDVVEPFETYDVARFVDDARAVAEKIRGRGRVPLVVGGTGLYLRALCRGLVPVAGRDDRLRAELESFRRQHGNEMLHARLLQVDPEAAARLPANDVVRVIRALEVQVLTGRPLSAQQGEHGFSDHPFSVCWLVVDQPPPLLEKRIAQRARAMFDGGLVDEAVALRARHGEIEVLRTLGYAEALALADGTLQREAAIEQTRLRTRRYAKRQRTWLRRERVDAWLVAPDPAALRRAIKASEILNTG
ncbi:MAG: tRNA (adenosine(37)-N6)-dimethylallyltransferase MiaA [Pseudomonadota bacterium]